MNSPSTPQWLTAWQLGVWRNRPSVRIWKPWVGVVLLACVLAWLGVYKLIGAML